MASTLRKRKETQKVKSAGGQVIHTADRTASGAAAPHQQRESNPDVREAFRKRVQESIGADMTAGVRGVLPPAQREFDRTEAVKRRQSNQDGRLYITQHSERNLNPYAPKQPQQNPYTGGYMQWGTKDSPEFNALARLAQQAGAQKSKRYGDYMKDSAEAMGRKIDLPGFGMRYPGLAAQEYGKQHSDLDADTEYIRNKLSRNLSGASDAVRPGEEENEIFKGRGILAPNDRILQNAMLSDEQKRTYNYLYATQGAEEAEKFRDTALEEGGVNAMIAQKAFDADLRNSSYPGKIAATYIGAVEGAADSLAGVPGMVKGEEQYRPRSTAEYFTSEAVRSELEGSLARTGLELAQSAGTNTLAHLASVAGGPALGSAVFAAQAGSRAYNESLMEGHTVGEATAYGAMQALDEEITNYLLGGLTAYGGGAVQRTIGRTPIAQMVGRELQGLMQTETGRYAMRQLMDAIANNSGEAAQEYLQHFTEEFEKWVAYNHTSHDLTTPEGRAALANDLPTRQQIAASLTDPEALHEALIGFLNAGIMNAPGQITEAADIMNRGRNSDLGNMGYGAFADAIDVNPLNYSNPDTYHEARDLRNLAQEYERRNTAGMPTSTFDRGIIDRAAYEFAAHAAEDPRQMRLADTGEEYAQETEPAYAQETEPAAETVTESVRPINDIYGDYLARKAEYGAKKAQNDQAMSEALAGTFGKEGKKAFAEMPAERSAEAYREFAAYYNSERFGTQAPAEAQTLTPEQVTAAMKAGALDANAAYPADAMKATARSAQRIQVDGVNAGVADRSGINYDALTPQQKLRVDFTDAYITKGLGMDVRYIQSDAVNGNYEGINGSFSVVNGRPTITLDVNAGMNKESDWTGDVTDMQTMLPVISHEITHFLEKSAPEAYKAISDAVIKSLANNRGYTGGYTINQIVRAEINRMDRTEKGADGKPIKHTEADALHEIVARACEDMLSGDTKAVQAFETLDTQTKATLWDHIKSVFDNIREFFQQMLSSYKSDSAEAKAIRQNMDEFEKIRSMWQEALASTEHPVNGNIASTSFSDGIGNNGIDVRSNTVQQMSERSYSEGGRKYLDNWLKRQVKSKNITEQDRTDILNALDEMKRVMEEIRTEEGASVDAYSRWSDTKAKQDRYKDDNGKWQKAFTAIVNNGEYKMNIDFSTVCKKRTALNSVLNTMVTSGVLNFETLTASEVVELNNIIKDEGFEIACALCFVDSKRYRIGSWAESFCEGSGKDGKAEDRRYGWNEIVRSMVPKGSNLNIADFNFTGRDIESNDTNLLSDYTSKVDMSLIKEIKANYGTATEAYKMAVTLEKHPEMRKILAPAEMISSAGLDLIKAQNKTLFKLINAHQGTAKPKLAFDNVAYGNDILKTQWTPGAALKVGGVRLQSFSDFQANMVFDYVQMVGEMQAKGLSCHSYTKEASFVAIFGKTGIKINMSLVPKSTTYTAEQVAKMSDSMRERLKATAGLDKDGNYIWEDETFPYEVAMHIQADPEYAKNCGTIAVGVSDPHIRKLLADPSIQMVIPYHKSSINHVVAALRNIALYNDYTNYQNTRTLDGKKLDGVPDFDFYAYMYGIGDSVKATKSDGSYDASGTNANVKRLHQNWKDGKILDGKTVANAYLDWCEKKGEFADRPGEVYLPRFDQFAYNEDGTRNENYYKLLADFRLYDENGNPAPQQAVKSVYPENVKDLIVNGYKFTDGKYHYENGGLKNATKVRDDLTAKTPDIINRFKEFRKKGYSESEIAIMQQAGREEVAEEERREELMNSRAQNSARGIREIDEEYAEALESGNEDWQLQLVGEAAYNAGYTVGAYHGSPFEDIHRFNTRSQNTKKQAKQLLFGTHFTQNLEYAKIYSRKAKNSKGTSRMASKEKKVYNVHLDLGKSLDLRTPQNIIPGMEEYKLYEDVPAKYKKKYPPHTFSKYDTEQGLGSGQFITKSTLENVLQAMSPKEATDFLVEHGYNSVLYDADYSTATTGNNRATRDPSIIMLDPERIKSGDPVTYDDNGNIIPLAERFNPASDDIRFSRRDADHDAVLAELVEKYGALPKGENAKVDVTLPEWTSDTKKTRRYARTVLESGLMSDQMSDEIKEKVIKEALSYEPMTDKDSAEYAASVLRAGGTAKAQKEWDRAKRSDSLNKDEMAVAQFLLKEYANNGDVDNVIKMVEEISAEATRMGQNIQSLRLLKKYAMQAPEVGLGYIQRTVDQMNRDNKRKMGAKYKEMKIDPALAADYLNAKTSDEIDAALGKIYKNLGSQVQMTGPEAVIDKLRTWRYLSMLGNPRTHVRNLVGNAIFVPAVRLKNVIGAEIEKSMGAERTKGLSATPEARAFAMKDALLMRDALSGKADMSIRDLIMEQRKVYKIEALNKLSKANSDALETEDWWFLRMHYQDALAKYITANNMDVNNMDGQKLAKARNYARKEAQKATYRDANKVSAWLNQSSGAGTVVKYMMEGMLPFKKTPTNILRRGVEYSPAGLIGTLTKGTHDLNTGKITLNEYIDGIASGLSGTAIFGVGMFLASTGLILGGYADDDDKERRKLRGDQEYAVRIGDHTYTVDWAAPGSLPLFIGVETMYGLKRDHGMTFSDITAATTRLVDPMINMSMLSGLNDTLDAISYSDDKLSAFASETFYSLLGQYVPTISGQIARTIDTTQRINYQDKNTGLSKNMLYFIEKMQNKIPYLTFSNDPYLNEFGQENVTESRFVAAIQNFISPGYISKVKDDRVLDELDRLSEAQDENVLPKKMPKYLGTKEDRVDLTSEQYTTFQRAAGQLSYNIIDNMIDDKRYRQLTAEEQAEAISIAYSYAKAAGRIEIQPEYKGKLNGNNKKVYNAVQGGSQAYDVILQIVTSK